MVPRETGNNDNAKFWRDKQRVLWHFDTRELLKKYFFVLSVYDTYKDETKTQTIHFRNQEKGLKVSRYSCNDISKEVLF